MQLKSNRLLLVSILALALYFGTGPLLPDPYLSSTVSLYVLTTGAALVLFYWRGFVDILFRRQRSVEDPGSHIGVYGAILAGMGAVIGALFNLAWVRAGSPPDWIGTVFSNLGRVLTATGYACLVVSPHIGRDGVLMPRQTTLVAMSVVVAVAAFVLGTQVRPTEPPMWPDVWYDHTRPICAPDRPVWGVSSSRIFHTPDSRYRSLVIPDRCFRSEWEARVAGYRPPA